MIIVRLLSPEPVGWYQHHQLYSGVGADIVMESIALIFRLLTDGPDETRIESTRNLSEIACSQQLTYGLPVTGPRGRKTISEQR
jgi:hypothetical protein